MNNLIKKENRICFKYDYMDDDLLEIYSPYDKDEKGGILAESENVNRIGVLEILNRYDDFLPSKPTFVRLIQGEYPFPDGQRKEICPIGLIDESDREIIELESFCSEYHCLPYTGGMDQQPALMVQAFNIIRGVKVDYQTRKMENARKEKNA